MKPSVKRTLIVAVIGLIVLAIGLVIFDETQSYIQDAAAEGLFGGGA
jgi:hypothetical protein